MSTISRTYPVARKPHRCTGCNAMIRVGERYYRLFANLGHDGLGTAKECARCCERYGRPISQEAA
jgi:phosphoribosylaminoimidazole (AIR) synthetase